MSKSRAVLTLFVFILAAVCSLLFSIQVTWAAVPATVTIQGTLESLGGEPVSGEFLYRVRFFDGQVDGNLLGETAGTTTVSEGGRFPIVLEPPQPVLDSTVGWYELAVDTEEDGIDEGDVFPERVRIHSVPFALRAGDADSLGGLVAQDYLPSASLATEVWSLDGNATGAGHFLGTTNDRSVELRVNGQRGFALIPNATSPVVIGGHSSNAVENGAAGATIAGGGWAGLDRNRVGGNYATVGGGKRNSAQGSSSTIGGGDANTTSENYATIAGGADNSAEGVYAAVGGGNDNGALSSYATVGGGYQNLATLPFCTIAGGSGNGAEDFSATVGGGAGNAASGEGSTIAGGTFNSAAGHYAMVAGGNENAATGEYSFAAGRRAKALHQGSFVWADSADEDVSSTTDDQFLVRASGGIGLTVNEGLDGLRILNPDSGPPNVIGGDGANGVGDGVIGATIGGGGPYSFYTANRVEESYGTVGGGVENSADGFGATVGGGVSNHAGSDYATVPGGYDSSAYGDHSFAAGYRAVANDTGSFVWSDRSSNSNFFSNEENEFAVRAENGLRLSEDAPPNKEVEFGQYYRDNSILAWAKVSSSGIANASHGLESVTHVPGSGVYTLTVTDNAEDANALIPIANAEIDTAPEAAADLRIVSINQRGSFPYKSFDVYINRGTGALVDNDFVFMLTGR